MVEVPNNIIESIKRFAIEAEKNNINIQQAILFGSYAKGNNTEWSDIDVAVVSENFEGIRFYDNLKLSKPVVRTNIDIETHPFRPEDFTEDNPFVKEILEYGIRII
ncbi:MAG: nucleotidyltransferase [Ignavibacteria bacterium]|nr:nucleotidyltransferase [Ignavibacteria bacterium]